MLKRSLLMLITFILIIVSCTGCKKHVGTSEDNAIIEEEEDEEAPVYTFGFSCITMENPYFITLEQSLRDTLEAEGHTLITNDPDLDVNQQIDQIDAMIADGIDAIFLCPVDWNKITPALENLRDAGVKIINIDSEVKEFDYVDAYIGSDNVEAGRICAKDLIEMCPDGGKIALLESPTQNSVNERITGFEEAIAGKGFEIAARYDTKGDLKLAREAMNEILDEHTDLVAVMCGNDQIALGALVSANTHSVSDMLIYGVDGSPDLKKELKKENTLIRGTCAQSPINLGKNAAELAINILQGNDYEKISYEEVFFITAENVEMYGIDGWQ
ncbi:MAG: sugar ABC transporter substrate-binding protein [bacterium]|nr:sugar ABC transporter substrate-binding protein [bacterium]